MEHFENANVVLNRFKNDNEKIFGIPVGVHRMNLFVNKALIYLK